MSLWTPLDMTLLVTSLVGHFRILRIRVGLSVTSSSRLVSCLVD